MSKRWKFETALAVMLVALYACLYLWQTPGLIRGTLTAAEIDGYVTALEKHMVAPPEAKRQFVADMRAWGAGDDGAPVYMVNLMRFHDNLRRWPGGPEFGDRPTPREANEHYEQSLAPLALRSGVYPIFNGVAQGPNLIDHQPAVDRWDRVAVMRFPSRRAFFEWASDPTFGQLFAYKLAAVEIALVPATAELVLPDMRLLFGAVLLIVYLLVCLSRARRYGRTPP